MGELLVGFLIGFILGTILSYRAFLIVLEHVTGKVESVPNEMGVVPPEYANTDEDEDDYDDADWWKVGKPNPYL